jgi:hypothetical protein
MAYQESLLSSTLAFSYAKETTYKTRPTNIDSWLRVKTHDVPIPVRETTPEYAHGAGREPQYVNDWQKWVLAGKFTYEVVTGEFLGAILGSNSVVGTDPYTHTMVATNQFIPSFSVQAPIVKSGSDVIMEFLGCRVNAATLKVSESDEKLMCDIDYLAATPSDGSSVESPVESIGEPFMFKKGVLSSTSLYGGAKARVYDFEAKIDNKCNPDHVSGYEYYPYDIVPGHVEYGELKATIGVDDDTEWDECIGAPGTLHDFSYLFTRGANDTLKISGTGKRAGSPFDFSNNNVRADLTLIPVSMEFEVVNSTPTFEFE